MAYKPRIKRILAVAAFAIGSLAFTAQSYASEFRALTTG